MSWADPADLAAEEEAWADALNTPPLDLESSRDHLEMPARPGGGVFTEVRVTTCTRTCMACGSGVYRSDPVVSVRTAPWAHDLTGGRWHVLTLCRGCGEHRTGVIAA